MRTEILQENESHDTYIHASAHRVKSVIHTYTHIYTHTYTPTAGILLLSTHRGKSHKSSHTYVYSYMYTYIHTYIHTYIPTAGILLPSTHRGKPCKLRLRNQCTNIDSF